VFSIRVLLRAFGDASIEIRNRGHATFSFCCGRGGAE